MFGRAQGLRRSFGLFAQTRKCQTQSAYDKVPFARGRVLSKADKAIVWKCRTAIFVFSLIFVGITVNALYDPWNIERFEGKLINYRPERYVKERENFNA